MIKSFGIMHWNALAGKKGTSVGQTGSVPFLVGVGFSRRGRTKFGCIERQPEAARAG